MQMNSFHKRLPPRKNGTKTKSEKKEERGLNIDDRMTSELCSVVQSFQIKTLALPMPNSNQNDLPKTQTTTIP